MPINEFQVQDRQAWPFLLIPKPFLLRYRPSWRATLAYTALRYYASNDSNACERISIRTMAQIVNVSEDTMKRGLKELEKKRLVKRVGRSKRSAKGERVPMPNLYVIQNIDLEYDDKI